MNVYGTRSLDTKLVQDTRQILKLQKLQPTA